MKHICYSIRGLDILKEKGVFGKTIFTASPVYEGFKLERWIFITRTKARADPTHDTPSLPANTLSLQESIPISLVTRNLAEPCHHHKAKAKALKPSLAEGSVTVPMGALGNKSPSRNTTKLSSLPSQGQETLEVEIRPTPAPAKRSQSLSLKSGARGPVSFALVRSLALCMRVMGMGLTKTITVHVHAFAALHAHCDWLRSLCTRGPKTKSHWNGQNDNFAYNPGRVGHWGEPPRAGEPPNHRDPAQRPPGGRLFQELTLQPLSHHLKQRDDLLVDYYQGGLIKSATGMLEQHAQLVSIPPPVALNPPPPLGAHRRPVQNHPPAPALALPPPPLSLPPPLPHRGNQPTNSGNTQSAPSINNESGTPRRGSAHSGPRNNPPGPSRMAGRRSGREGRPDARKPNSEQYPGCTCHHQGWLDGLAPSKATRHWKETCPANPEKFYFPCDVAGCNFKTKQQRNLVRHRQLTHEEIDHLPPPNQGLEE
ncbi:hypothetical protein FRB99_004451 [Tulasnella sp. 403]|nr:hypothetical protein FRB99_004451 [Tulasnella sp. 403]